MNVLALAIPLTTLLDLTNLCASTAARCPRLVLNTSADWQSLFTGDLGQLLVVFAHGSGFPLTDATRSWPRSPVNKDCQTALVFRTRRGQRAAVEAQRFVKSSKVVNGIANAKTFIQQK